MEKRLFLLIIALAITSLIPQETQTAKILSVAFMSSKSHKITYEPLLYELAKRGHQLTIVAPYVSGKKIQNVREIKTVDFEALIKEMPNMYEMREKGISMNPFTMLKEFGNLCSTTLDLPAVQAIAKEKFDMIIMQPLFNECTSGWVYTFNTTILLITPTTAPTWLSSVLGTPSPPSFVPNLFTGFDDIMSFKDRVINFLVEGLMRGIQYFYYQPAMAAIYREKLNNPNIPLHDEIMRNASLLLANSHFSLSKPRPLLPDIIEVGGMHCRPAEPLPKDLDDFLNSSGSDGFIYFSMGSALKGSEMPEKYRKLFVNVFSKLKQKVLWKWETETMPDLPKNVKLGKWLPQQDILGHKNIKGFLTHGGFGGTTEAVYHGVPLIGMPMLGDQHLNMKKSVAAGFAVSLEWTTLTEHELLDAINEVVGKPKYRERVQHMSKIFRDQPDKPLDRAVFWTEYVLKHKGAVHLRSAARDLNFFQYHSLDVIAFLLTATFLTLYLVFAILRFIVRKICCRSSSTTKNLAADNKKKRN